MGRKRKERPPKEEIAEDLCFVCKDGGLLQICDYRNCLKAYHPQCVGNPPSILETEKQWSCSWHFCFICQKGSAYHCLCCPISVCGRCIRDDAEFITVKKKKMGFCINCLKLATLIEENADADSDGGKVDFQDRGTSEFLFKEYWDLVREKEGLTLQDLHTARSRLKRREVFESGSESDEDEVLEEDLVTEMNECLSKKRSGMKTPTKRSRAKKNFLHWSSGESSEGEVDEGLRKKHVGFKTPTKRSGKKNFLSWAVDENSVEGDNSKKYERIQSDPGLKNEPSNHRRKVVDQPKSEHAALVGKNINPVYLRKSLILKLLDGLETFEFKVTGCFVRVKIDPKDFYILPVKRYQLGQIKGIKRLPQTYNIGAVSTDVVLCITNIKDSKISMLSDDDIEEEELEDLREMLKRGIFKRPSIAELEKKMKSMHNDIMSHWIDREISRLDKMIERANEKGWRAELFESIDKRELLRTPKERTRLLEEIPSVIVDTEGTIDASVEKVAEEAEETITALVEKVAEEAEAIISASIEKTAVEDAEGVHAAVLEAPLQEVEDTRQHKPNNNRTSINSKSDDQHSLLDANGITGNISGMESESSGKLLDAQGTSNNRLSTKSESDEQQRPINADGIKIIYTKQHKPNSNRTSINSKSDEQHGLLNANRITRNLSSMGSESSGKLLDAQGTSNNKLSTKSESDEQQRPINADGLKIIYTKQHKPNSNRTSINSKSGKQQGLLNADRITRNISSMGSESSGKLLDAQGTSVNISSTKSESDEQQKLLNTDGIRIVYTKQHKPKSNGTSINSKSNGQCRLLDAKGITGNISSMESESSGRLVDAQGTSSNRLSTKSESDEQQKLLNAYGIKRNGLSICSEFHNQHRSLDVNGINNMSSMMSESDAGHPMNKKSSEEDIIVLDDEEDEAVDDAGVMSSLRESPHPKIQTICLDDDDDDESNDAGALISRTEKVDPAIWHYVDQYNEVQGPFTKIQLRRWQRHFKSDFKVWRSYQTPNEAIFLYDVLGSPTL